MDDLPYFFDLLKSNSVIHEAVTKRALSADDLAGIKYNRGEGNVINLSNFLLNEHERFKSASILLSRFGMLIEFISNDLKYFNKTDFYFNTNAIARKRPSHFKRGKEFKVKGKRLEQLKLFDKVVNGAVLQSELYGCKIMISFF